METLAVGIILGAGFMWVWFERRRFHGAILTLQGHEMVTAGELGTMRAMVEDVKDRLEAVENPIVRAASEQAERDRIRTRLETDPRYKDYPAHQLEQAVEQLYSGVRRMRPKERA